MEHSVHKTAKQAVCTLLALSLLAGCSPQKEAVATEAEVDTGIRVEVAAPEKGSMTASTEYIATIEPDEVVSVYPKVAGTVSVIHAQVGDTVKKGDLLFEIDPTDIQLQVNIAKSALNTAQASVLTAQAQVDQQLGSGYDLQLAQLQSQVKSAQTAYANARQSLRDYNDKADVSMEDLDEKLADVNAGRQQTEAALNAVRQNMADCAAGSHSGEIDGYDNHGPSSDHWAYLNRQFSNLNSKLTELEQTHSMLQANFNELDDSDSSTHSQLRTAVKNAQVAYDSANTIYDLTKDGVYKDALKVANASLGQATAGYEQAAASYEQAARQLVYTKVYSPIDGVIEAKNISEQGPVSQSTPTYTVSNKSTVTATFYVPADAAQVITMGDMVTVENGRQVTDGTVTEVGSMADAQTGLFKIKASVSNTVGLMSGLTVKVILNTAKTENALLISQDSLYYEEGKPYVYVAQDGKAVKTMVELGISSDEQVEVLTGITADSQIITSWNANLRDGAALDIQAADSPGAQEQKESSAPEALEANSSASSETDTAEAASEAADSSSDAQEG